MILLRSCIAQQVGCQHCTAWMSNWSAIGNMEQLEDEQGDQLTDLLLLYMYAVLTLTATCSGRCKASCDGQWRMPCPERLLANFNAC
jgi:hypothetical protein